MDIALSGIYMNKLITYFLNGQEWNSSGLPLSETIEEINAIVKEQGAHRDFKPQGIRRVNRRSGH